MAGFIALFFLAIASWSLSAAIWPGLLILLLALVYGVSVATGGAFFENLIDTGQRLWPIASAAGHEIHTSRTGSATYPRPILPIADPVNASPNPFPAHTASPLEIPTPTASTSSTSADQNRAADPNTSQQTLMNLAASRPELRPTIALNPNAYPDLLTWLSTIGDPAIDAALRQRG
ncbi:hypothetical protein [Rhodococcus sp. MALMAid1271]|uniref:variant leucine-rich repeat-containing protein n=1 Tax=Rhodococcus sp. MALMAid1271 TaxID=3411744 RepID=UPI003BA07CB2